MPGKRIVSSLITILAIFSSCAVSAETRTAAPQGAAAVAADYNTKGVLALEKNLYTEAADCFLRALDILPDDSTIKHNLAITYNNLAISFNENKRPLDAKDYLYRAIDLDKTNALYKENLANISASLAVAHYQNGNYEWAAQELKTALAFSPSHTQGLMLLGQIYYQQQELYQAETVWKKARAQDPYNAELERLLNNLQSEKKVEPGLPHLDSRNFHIRFDKEVVDKEIYNIREFLQDAYGNVGRDFDYFPPHKIPVILYSEEDFISLRQTPGRTNPDFYFVSGIYDGKIRIPVKKDLLKNSIWLKKLIWHEYTHAVVFYLTDGKCPVWFNEGLAKYQETKHGKMDPRETRALKLAVNNKTLIPLWELDNAFSLNTDPQILNLAYLQSYSFIVFMLDRWNFAVIRSVLRRVKSGQSLEQALYDMLGRTPERLEKEWLDYLGKTGV